MAVLNNYHSDQELVDIRSSHEDPLVQYYIVNKDLNMSSGKTSAQTAHGSGIFLLYYFDLIKKFSTVGPHGGWEFNEYKTIKKWLDGSFRKVVLGADTSKFNKIKEELKCFLVKDAGLTEVESGSETVLVLFPMLKSQAPKSIKKLRVL